MKKTKRFTKVLIFLIIGIVFFIINKCVLAESAPEPTAEAGDGDDWQNAFEIPDWASDDTPFATPIPSGYAEMMIDLPSSGSLRAGDIPISPSDYSFYSVFFSGNLPNPSNPNIYQDQTPSYAQHLTIGYQAYSSYNQTLNDVFSSSGSNSGFVTYKAPRIGMDVDLTTVNSAFDLNRGYYVFCAHFAFYEGLPVTEVSDSFNFIGSLDFSQLTLKLKDSLQVYDDLDITSADLNDLRCLIRVVEESSEGDRKVYTPVSASSTVDVANFGFSYYTWTDLQGGVNFSYGVGDQFSPDPSDSNYAEVINDIFVFVIINPPDVDSPLRTAIQDYFDSHNTPVADRNFGSAGFNGSGFNFSFRLRSTTAADDRKWFMKLLVPTQDELFGVFNEFVNSTSMSGANGICYNLRNMIYELVYNSSDSRVNLTLPAMSVPIEGVDYQFFDGYSFPFSKFFSDPPMDKIMTYVKTINDIIITGAFVNALVAMFVALFDLKWWQGVQDSESLTDTVSETMNYDAEGVLRGSSVRTTNTAHSYHSVRRGRSRRH